MAYFTIVDSSTFDVPNWWFEQLWKWHLHTKLKCFMWLSFENCLLTWDNLQRRNWTGPNICVLCMKAE